MAKTFDANGVDVDAYPDRAYQGGVYEGGVFGKGFKSNPQTISEIMGPPKDSKPTYEKVQPEDGPIYTMIQRHQAHGNFICDSRDHNEDTGCSNPDCFKYNKK